jgi:uncharacterized protein YjeT (DUF2065 family)
MNLLETLMKNFGGDTVGQLAKVVGGDSADVGNLVKGLLPTILAGLSTTASAPGGADKIAAALKGSSEGKEFDLDSILNGGPAKVEEATKKGTSILEGLFGKGMLLALLPVLGKVLGNSGLITKLLPLLAPMALKMIVGQMGGKSSGGGGGFDIGSLTKLLVGQKSSFLGALPSGLGDALKGVQGFADLGGDVARTAGAAAQSVGKAVDSAAHSASRAAGQAADAGSDFMSKLLPLALGALALLAGLYFFTRPAADKVDAAKDAAGKAANQAAQMTTQIAGEAKKAAANAGKAVEGAVEGATDALGEVGDAFLGNAKGMFKDLTGLLDGIKDADTATAAAPKLEEQYSILEKMIAGTKDLPEAAQGAVGAVVKEATGALNSKITEILGLPGVADILKPILDKITAGLVGWFK